MPARVTMLKFADKYLDDRIQTYGKDMAICLTPDDNGTHAYFPALLASLSLLDLFSCLEAGDLKPRGMKHIIAFCHSHLFQPEYDEFHVTLIWLMFRHKTVHASQPYGTFDTYARQSILQKKPRMKVTWKLDESESPHAISLLQDAGDLPQRAPWPCPHTHRLTIYLPQLQHDITQAVDGPKGYRAVLRLDTKALDRFTKCMEEIFPK
jgi:hypothetical protein